jgi:hypothetical protein
MTNEDHVDGNALGGVLTDIFGREMTHARACCARCASVGPMGGLIAYTRAPGAVLRCATCGTVMLVAVPRPTGLRVTFEAIKWVASAQR